MNMKRILLRSDVNGATRIPLYQWALVSLYIISFSEEKLTKTSLQSRCPSPIPTFFEDANLLLYSPMSQEDVRWNWEKASRNKLQNDYRKTCFKLYAGVT